MSTDCKGLCKSSWNCNCYEIEEKMKREIYSVDPMAGSLMGNEAPYRNRQERRSSQRSKALLKKKGGK